MQRLVFRALAKAERKLIRLTALICLAGCVLLTNGAMKANAQLTITPSIARFGSVPIGTTNTQTFQLKNVGSKSAEVLSLGLFGSGFTISGSAARFAIPAHGTATFTVAFKPTSAKSYSGSLSVASTAPGKLGTVLISGTGESSTVSLSASPTSLSFGNVTLGGSATADVTVKNSGNSSVTIKSVTSSGTGLSVTGLSAGTTIAAGQSAQIVAEFSGKTAGVIAGSITISSSATTITIAVSADVVSGNAHAVDLSWGPSSSGGVTGYNVYRSSKSGSGYAKVASVGGTSFADSAVQAGATYYYVVTAVSSGGESGYSNQTSAVVP